MALSKIGALPVPPGGRLRSLPPRHLRAGLAAGLPRRALEVPAGAPTISLLPDYLCAGFTGTLDEVEAVVAVAEAAPTREAASEALRPEVELPGALRWMRRRTRLVHAGLATAIGLLPGLLAGREPTVSSIRLALGAENVLVRLRAEVAPHLAGLPPPLGFGPRPARRRPSPTALQHEAGPDPPVAAR